MREEKKSLKYGMPAGAGVPKSLKLVYPDILIFVKQSSIWVCIWPILHLGLMYTKLYPRLTKYKMNTN